MYFIALAELLIQVKAGQIVGLLFLTSLYPVSGITPTPASIDSVHKGPPVINISGIQLGVDLVCNQLGFHPTFLLHVDNFVVVFAATHQVVHTDDLPGYQVFL